MNRNVLRHILGALALAGVAFIGVGAAQAPADRAPADQTVLADSQWGSNPTPDVGEDDSQWG
ncbi:MULTISPECIES: hypothetical protein [Streptomyces]|uniref:Secreted protein n=1 Tax=Streptomyces tibetensis TaxID=2382123 RepID=A0ABW6MVD8_9ACTN|nr:MULTISPECIES: hypothetical protein [Streptomyces]PPS69349.1 hypothetical protein BV882_27440 [Streptomyces sp. 46]